MPKLQTTEGIDSVVQIIMTVGSYYCTARQQEVPTGTGSERDRTPAASTVRIQIRIVALVTAETVPVLTQVFATSGTPGSNIYPIVVSTIEYIHYSP